MSSVGRVGSASAGFELQFCVPSLKYGPVYPASPAVSTIIPSYRAVSFCRPSRLGHGAAAVTSVHSLASVVTHTSLKSVPLPMGASRPSLPPIKKSFSPKGCSAAAARAGKAAADVMHSHDSPVDDIHTSLYHVVASCPPVSTMAPFHTLAVWYERGAHGALSSSDHVYPPSSLDHTSLK